MLRSLLLLPAILLTLSAAAQPGFKVFDINPNAASSNPVYLTPFNGKLYFYGNDGASGRELMEATSDTAILVQNVNAGQANSVALSRYQPIAGLGGRLYFTADNGASGTELFSYNGTSAKLEADITFSVDNSSPDNYVAYNGRLYFTATTVANGQELYIYDTINSPARLTDINAGPDSSVYGPMVVYKAKLYFVVNTPATGAELWSYDPVQNSTQLEADIDTGAASSNPANLTVLNGKLYFSATTFMEGRELYEYDGSNPPARLTDINPSALSSIIPSDGNAYAYYNSKLYFAARDTSGDNNMYVYDPSTQQSALAFPNNPINANGSSNPRELVIYNNKLFFSAYEPTYGYELYSYDGSNPPALVADICQGPNGSNPTELTVIGDELYMTANNCLQGNELMSYNYKRVSVEEIPIAIEANIYPNPVSKDLNIQFTLQTDEQLYIHVTDIYGRSIYSIDNQKFNAGSNTVIIPMQNATAGFYVYYIQGNSGVTYLKGKVLKQ